MCDHVAVMVAGRIAWVGPLDALRGSGTLEDAFVAVVGERAVRQGLSWLGHSSD
jgi:ABC-2 type transport system ATP-binding protein